MTAPVPPQGNHHPSLRAVPPPTDRQVAAIRRRGVPEPTDDGLDALAKVVGIRDARRAETPPLPFPKRYHRTALGRDGIWTAACKACGYTHLAEWPQVGVKHDSRGYDGQPAWMAFFDCPYVPEFEIHVIVDGDVAIRCIALGARDVAADARDGGGGVA